MRHANVRAGPGRERGAVRAGPGLPRTAMCAAPGTSFAAAGGPGHVVGWRPPRRADRHRQVGSDVAKPARRPNLMVTRSNRTAPRGGSEDSCASPTSDPTRQSAAARACGDQATKQNQQESQPWPKVVNAAIGKRKNRRPPSHPPHRPRRVRRRPRCRRRRRGSRRRPEPTPDANPLAAAAPFRRLPAKPDPSAEGESRRIR